MDQWLLILKLHYDMILTLNTPPGKCRIECYCTYRCMNRQSVIIELFLLLCRLFVDLKRLSDPVLRDHLQLDSPSKPELSIQTFPYETVYSELQAICAALGPKDKVWICDKASCALTQVIPKVTALTYSTSNCAVHV